MIISRTPYRISLLGGGTDYPTWFEHGTGSVLSFTINKYCTILARRLPPFFEHKNVVTYREREYTQTIDEISHPAVREILKYYAKPNGWEIIHSGDLPARSGMGSSSAFIVGFTNIMYHADGDGNFLNFAMGDGLFKKVLALEAIHIERDILKERVGCQDQIATTYGGLNFIEFNEFEFTVDPVLIPMGILRKLQNHLILCYTKGERVASEIVETYIDKLKEMEELKRLESFPQEGIKLIGNGDMVGLGLLLHESWGIKKKLSPFVTNPTIDAIYDAALVNGAYGGKLLGAGGGGFMLLCASPSNHRGLFETLKSFDIIPVPFEIEFGGSRIIFPRN